MSISLWLKRRQMLGWALLLTPLAARATGNAAPALLLADEAPADADPQGHLVSEKLDGVRAHWDGHTLRFRGGGVIQAPADWLARLPKGVALDGELWLGRGRFDALSGLVRRREPDAQAWRAVGYHVFELPDGAGPFSQRAERLAALATQHGTPLVAVPQRPVASQTELLRWLRQVVDGGGEGLVLHRADAPYVTGRQRVLLKLKPWQDADAEVIAHLPGAGRHAGRLGALRLRTPEGRTFDLGTGLTDAQRVAPPPLGSQVSYRYRGLTASGLPRFASYWRVRDAGW